MKGKANKNCPTLQHRPTTHRSFRRPAREAAAAGQPFREGRVLEARSRGEQYLVAKQSTDCQGETPTRIRSQPFFVATCPSTRRTMARIAVAVIRKSPPSNVMRLPPSRPELSKRHRLGVMPHPSTSGWRSVPCPFPMPP